MEEEDICISDRVHTMSLRGVSWVELGCSHPAECAPHSPKIQTGLPHVDPIAPAVIFVCIKGSDKVRFM